MSSITMESSNYISSIVEGLSDPNLIMNTTPSSSPEPDTPPFQPTTIKMEDLEASSMTDVSSTDFLTVPTDGTSSTAGTDKKGPKKRKVIAHPLVASADNFSLGFVFCSVNLLIL